MIGTDVANATSFLGGDATETLVYFSANKKFCVSSHTTVILATTITFQCPNNWETTIISPDTNVSIIDSNKDGHLEYFGTNPDTFSSYDTLAEIQARRDNDTTIVKLM